MGDLGTDWGLFGLWYVICLFSLTVHEGAHALVARLGGDDTAYQGGQVTLNPLPHMRREPMGTLLVPVVSYLSFGWVMGWASTPFDPYWAERHPRRAALMSLAGPGSNFLLAMAAFVCARILLITGSLEAPDLARFDRVVAPAAEGGLLGTPSAHALSILLMLNVLLFLFNLIPLPPLDGSGALEGLLPEAAARRYRAFRSTPGVPLMALVAVWIFFGRIFDGIFSLVLLLLHPGVPYR